MDSSDFEKRPYRAYNQKRCHKYSGKDIYF